MSSSKVDRVSKPAYPVVSSSDSVTNINKSLNSLPLIHIILIPVHYVPSLSHRNIHCKRKLRKSVISSSFFNSANSHDIASKLIMDRDKSNVLTID